MFSFFPLSLEYVVIVAHYVEYIFACMTVASNKLAAAFVRPYVLIGVGRRSLAALCGCLSLIFLVKNVLPDAGWDFRIIHRCLNLTKGLHISFPSVKCHIKAYIHICLFFPPAVARSVEWI